MFGSYGKAVGSTSLTFVSAAGLAGGAVFEIVLPALQRAPAPQGPRANAPAPQR